MLDDSSRNTIIFLVCALVLFILYNQFVMGPRQKALEAERKAHPPVAAATASACACPRRMDRRCWPAAAPRAASGSAPKIGRLIP